MTAPQKKVEKVPEVTPAAFLPHIATEFLIWLWFITERDGGTLNVTETTGEYPTGPGIIDMWIDEKIAMRNLDGSKTATFSAENAPSSLSARAAISHQWHPSEIRFHLRREEREYTFTLSGSSLDLKGAKLPPVALSGEDEAIYDRMMMLEEIERVVQSLFRQWAKERTSKKWGAILATIRSWLATGVAEHVDE